MEALGCDFVAFSAHKMLGPSGIGGSGAARSCCRRCRRSSSGLDDPLGHSRRTSFAELPYKFEAGTPPIAESYGFGIAIDYVHAVGLERSRRTSTSSPVRDGPARRLPFVRVFGPPAERRAGIVSFEVEGVHPHDVAQILDSGGIAVRAGHHCTQPVMDHFGVSATTRASFYLYTVPEEIDRLVEGLAKVHATFA